MLGTSMQFGRGEDRFFPARPRRNYGHHHHRNLQRSQSAGARGAANGGSASPAAPVTTGKFAVLDDREPENSKPAEVPVFPTPAEGIGRSSNLDRFLESTTPTVPAQYLPKTTIRGWRTCDVEYRPYFVLGDLWESFKEWSAYGAGVPLVMNETNSVMQYYVPYLSGIQLYGEPTREPVNLRGPGEESDSDCSRDSTSDGSSDSELERGLKYSWDWNHRHHVSVSALRMDRLSLREKHVDSQEGSSSDDREADNSQGLLLFEFLERDLPYSREPLADKATSVPDISSSFQISDLACRFPGLKTLRSCDLLSSSWISVAWYPIYRIPTGPTLRDLDACFLTFHFLSTPRIESHFGTGSMCDPDGIPKISLPTFGLASYKLKGSMWSSNAGSERANSLLQVADTWLRGLHVTHPDYQFFSSHGSYRR
ncbi:hypothetical protein Taro_029804 [Colocasia esculenta]|uniref:Uncharacterized protein n=1 Tax=Colocasia esculenta TaxID=4460 RepID=A0A843VUA6_COLES|nr:hypothetical protein [Colocasia esculenta]